MNKQIRRSSENEFFRLFFGRISEYQMAFWNYLTFSFKEYISIIERQKTKVIRTRNREIGFTNVFFE
jgi:hypothetical protein